MSAKDQIKQIVDFFKRENYLRDKTDGMAEGLLLGASLADEANELSKDVQAQVDQLVIEGDSSVEAAQARVDADGKSYVTLKKRLDEKEQEVTAQLAQMVINVKKFGAVGNGVNDDSQAIRSAMQVLRERKGGVLYFPIGTYLVSGNDTLAPNPQVNFYLNFSNLKIEGESKHGSIIKVADGQLKESLFGNYNVEGLKNIEATNITFDLNGQNNKQLEGSRASKAALFTYFIDDYHIHNCVFLNAPGEHVVYSGMSLSDENAKNIHIHDNVFLNTADSIEGNVYAIDHSAIFTTGKNIRIYNNDFINENYSYKATAIECDASNAEIFGNYIKRYQFPFIVASDAGQFVGGNYSGTKKTTAHNVNIHDNTILDCFENINLYSYNLGGIKNINFHSNTIKLVDDVNLRGTSYLFRCKNMNGFLVEDISIYNNDFSTNGDFTVKKGVSNGIDIDHVLGLKVYNNTFKNIGGFGVRVGSVSNESLSENIRIFDNDIIDVCGNSVDGFTAAFSFVRGMRNVVIKNNTIKNDKLTYCKKGIELYGGSVVYDDVLIENNKISKIDIDIASSSLLADNFSKLIVIHNAEKDYGILNNVKCSDGSRIDYDNGYFYKIRTALNKVDFGTTKPTTAGNKGDVRYNENYVELVDENFKSYFIYKWVCDFNWAWREDRVYI